MDEGTKQTHQAPLPEKTDDLNSDHQLEMRHHGIDSSDHDELSKTYSNSTRPALVPTVSYAAPLAAITSNPEQPHDHYATAEKSNLERTVSSTSTSTTSTYQQHATDPEVPISRVSTDPLGNTYPEGGKEAYLVVFGSFCGCILSLGLMNTLSTYSAYISQHQLADLDPSKIGWIFGVFAFFSFFLGIQIGPLFDAYGPRWLVLTGSIFILADYLLLSICRTYVHFILVFGVLGGTGVALVFTPSIAAVGHWFYLRRGTFTGIACVGGSLGGIIFPLALQALFDMPNIGWPWSQRILALINLPLAIAANLLIKSRLPPRHTTKISQILPDPRIFRDQTFALVTLAVFFVEWGLFIPISYLTTFALSIGVEQKFAYQLIAIFNAGSCLGRWLPGILADRIGRFNAMIATTVICWVSTFAFWISSEIIGDSYLSQSTTIGASPTAVALLILFSVTFGFGSGSGISLIPVCVGQLCRTEDYGRYYATCYTIVSFATLTGIPIAGSLVTATGGGRYWGLILFAGINYAISTVVFLAAKGGRVGFGSKLWKEKF